MNSLVKDASKTTVIFVNDFNIEYVEALKKLSVKLGRQMRGLILIDKTIKDQKINKPDIQKIFSEIVCDFNDLYQLSSVINSIKDSTLLLSVSSERNQPYFSKLVPHFENLLLPSESSIEWSTNKNLMRKMFNSYDKEISVKSFQIKSLHDLKSNKNINQLKYPVILKPNGLAASILVQKISSYEALLKAAKKSFSAAEEIYKRDRGRGVPSFLVEEYIDGDMYSMDCYVNHKGDIWCLPLVHVVTADSIGLEGFYSYSIDSKLDLSTKETKKAEKVAKKAIKALCLKSSVAHIELFKTKNGWKIIELGPRAGGYRQIMYASSYGVDHAYNELLIRCGFKPEIKNKSIAFSSTINIYAQKEGTISSISGFEQASNNPSVEYLKLHKKPGDQAIYCGNGGTFIVDGILKNISYESLERDKKIVRDTIKVEINE